MFGYFTNIFSWLTKEVLDYISLLFQNDEARLICCNHPQLEYMQRYNAEYTWESFYQDDADFLGENKLL